MECILLKIYLQTPFGTVFPEQHVVAVVVHDTAQERGQILAFQVQQLERKGRETVRCSLCMKGTFKKNTKTCLFSEN